MANIIISERGIVIMEKLQLFNNIEISVAKQCTVS